MCSLCGCAHVLIYNAHARTELICVVNAGVSGVYSENTSVKATSVNVKSCAHTEVISAEVC